jgi:hypothetical protein
VLPAVPVGIEYIGINGGGYVVGSFTAPKIGWLGQDGTWNPVAWVDTDPEFNTNFTSIVSVRFSTWDEVILVTRVDPINVWSAITAIDPFTWTTVWTTVLGPGWAFDVSNYNSYIYVTEGKFGGLWTFTFYAATAPTSADITYGNTSLFAPWSNSPVAFGATGVVAVSSSEALVSIGEQGVYRERFYCVDTTNSDPNTWTYTTLTLAGGNQDSLNYNGAISLVSYAYGDWDVVGFVSAPNGVGTLSLPSGTSWCGTGLTYTLSNWNTSSTQPTQYPLSFGLGFSALTFNCDLNITVALGTSYNGLPGYPVLPPSNYSLYVATGNLPFTAPGGFVAGNACANAIEVTPGALGLVYDLSCYSNSRVSNAYSSPRGYGVWFKVNTTGLTGTWSFTTRTVATNFDNYLLFYDACPTSCPTDASYYYDPFITSNDDSSPSSQPNCDVGGLCAQKAFDLGAPTTGSVSTTTYSEYTRPELYVLVSFYDGSVATNGDLHVSSFQVIVDGTLPQNANPLNLPQQICDPRITVPPTDTPTTAGGGSTGVPSGVTGATTAGVPTTAATGPAATTAATRANSVATTNPASGGASATPTGSATGTQTGTQTGGGDNGPSADSSRFSLFF